MNSFELIVVVFSSVLVLVLLSVFFNDLLYNSFSAYDRIDLVNIINIYGRGKALNVSFSVFYEPYDDGFLAVNDDVISIDNVSVGNVGVRNINCSFGYVLINEGGLSCLN